MTAKFNLVDNAVMMCDNKPIRVIVTERRFIRKEYLSRFRSGKETTSEYVEYTVTTYCGTTMKVSERELFHTLEELFENLTKNTF